MTLVQLQQARSSASLPFFSSFPGDIIGTQIKPKRNVNGPELDFLVAYQLIFGQIKMRRRAPLTRAGRGERLAPAAGPRSNY